MRDSLCEANDKAIPLTLVTQAEFADLQNALDARDRAWIAANNFTAGPGQFLAVPAADGHIDRVLAGISRTDDIYALAGAYTGLPKGDYRLDSPLDAEPASRLAFGWALGAYAFDRYRGKAKQGARLVWPAEADRDRVLRELDAVKLVRDLVNIPANDLGPAALAEAARVVAAAHGAMCHVTVGDQLVQSNFPAVYAVGQASAQPPRVVDLRWGDQSHPEITLCGKGITFDTGGLDIKTGSSMGLMKKDMGGAAHALALGQMIMEAKLKVRLRVLIAIAENSVGPTANRPGDVIKTRAGLTVEIGNTDAEGRLVLADILAAAYEANPVAVIDFATLTGAARVALGPDLPALFATDGLADEILAACKATEDPVWRLPLWAPYRRNMDSKIADINNNASNSFAGAIHAALFLQEFVKPGTEWAHFDLYAWNASARPGRPVGGEAFALRGLFHMLKERYGR
ncbi:MAG TPA: leucyl aminopeptidase family protein [Alphaproteobacteria bacterium]|jgi:leucyl aminopeptidase|nr:leucyl aminopeptidase family protein [Alphaproteobacteria bacterium]